MIAGPVETAFLQERMGFSEKEAQAIKDHERRLIPLGRKDSRRSDCDAGGGEISLTSRSRAVMTLTVGPEISSGLRVI